MLVLSLLPQIWAGILFSFLSLISFSTILSPYSYALSADETAARKKLKSDLEFKKKENERRKKKGTTPSNLTLSKSHDKSPAAPKEESTSPDKPPTSAKKGARSVKKVESTIDDQIATLQPAEGIALFFILLLCLFVYLFVYLFINSFVYLFINSFIY
jgi:hypothetical protein